MTDIDQLTGVELRRAVAEAVGLPRYFVDQLTDWNWALAAIEAAGVKTVVIDFGNGVLMESGQFAVGATPESCLRALLHTLAARNSQQPHVAAEGET